MTGSECVDCTAARRLVRVRFARALPGHPCDVAEGLELSTASAVVVLTGDGERVGTLSRFDAPPRPACAQRRIGTVVRRATQEDLARSADLEEISAGLLDLCRRRAEELGLPIQPVTVTVALDRDALTITFAAEERVNVRELAQELSAWARRPVVLRPVGVRDRAKATGGLGHCGRPLCCAAFMERFSSVTVKMAKAQNLALNPSRISGQCGRLMCCLSHEAPPAAARRA